MSDDAAPMPVPTYAALLAFLQQQLDKLQMTLEGYDMIAGWADGSAAHVLGGDKDFSGPSLFVALNALGCELVVRENPQLVARIMAGSRYKPRHGKPCSPLVRAKARKRVVRHSDMQIYARMGGLRRAALPAAKLSKINRKAALTRWRNARIAVAIS